MLPFKSLDQPPQLPPVRSDEFLPPVSRWILLGGLVLIGGVMGAIALASLVRYNITVQAPAVVRPDNGIRVVQAGLEGRVVSIDVETNQVVNQGDVLAQLERGSLETQQTQIQITLRQSEAQLEQLSAQLRLLDAQRVAESQSINQSISVAQSELTQAQRSLAEQQAIAQANLLEAEATLELAQSEVRRYELLVESGAVSQLQLEEKQAALRTAEAQRDRALAVLNPLAASVAIAQDQVKQQQAQGNASLALLQREKEVLIQQQLELQKQLERDRRTLAQLETELQQTEIRATSDGIILRLNLRNPNQVVQAGDVIAEIAPDTTTFVIKAAINTDDIDQVQVGQSASLRIAACPHPDFGLLSGTVIAISPDVLVPGDPTTLDPSTKTVQNAYYEVNIQPETMILIRGDRQCELQPGMTADAHIISREETLLRYMLRKARLLTNL